MQKTSPPPSPPPSLPPPLLPPQQTKCLPSWASTPASPPRFHMSFSHTSSITIPLSPSIPLPSHTSSPRCCRRYYNRDSGGLSHCTNNSPKKLQSFGNNNEHENNNNKTVSTTHTQEKCIFSPHPNRSGILCHNFVSNSPGFYFSAVYLGKNYLSVLRTPLGVVSWYRTKSQNDCLFTLKLHHAMVAPFLPLVHYGTSSYWYPSFHILISLHPVYVWSPVGYTNSIPFFSLLTSWPAACKRSVFLQFCDQIESSMHQIFTQMHSPVL